MKERMGPERSRVATTRVCFLWRESRLAGTGSTRAGSSEATSRGEHAGTPARKDTSTTAGRIQGAPGGAPRIVFGLRRFRITVSFPNETQFHEYELDIHYNQVEDRFHEKRPYSLDLSVH